MLYAFFFLAEKEIVPSTATAVAGKMVTITFSLAYDIALVIPPGGSILLVRASSVSIA